ncbi:hypothetical protein BHM03_00016413 [Ensete ventricosum]|nr:hypothetical protein BHM03_00016413 [Ensete ventricosum]
MTKVRRKLAEDIGSLLVWRQGVRQKKIETHRKIAGGSRKACREFAKGIKKLAMNTSGDRWRKIVRLAVEDFEGCRNAGVRSLSLVVMFD